MSEFLGLVIAQKSSIEKKMMIHESSQKEMQSPVLFLQINKTPTWILLHTARPTICGAAKPPQTSRDLHQAALRPHLSCHGFLNSLAHWGTAQS